MNTTNIATMASSERTDGSHNIDRDRTTIKSNVGNDLPSYPEQRIHQQQQQQQQHMNNQSDRDANEKLLEDFPPKANTTLLEEFPSKHNQNKATDTINNSAAARKRNKKPCIGDLEEAYPGFAFYQTARVQYCLGKYNEALDTTTECLAFQKLALGSSKASTTSPKLRPRSSMKTENSAKTDDNSNYDITNFGHQPSHLVKKAI